MICVTRPLNCYCVSVAFWVSVLIGVVFVCSSFAEPVRVDVVNGTSIIGITGSNNREDAGVYGKGRNLAVGVRAESNTGIAVSAFSRRGTGVLSRVDSRNGHAGYFIGGSGVGLQGSALYSRADSDRGIALWAENANRRGTDAAAVFLHRGSGPLIKGFGGNGGEHEFAVLNNGMVWTRAGVEIAGGADLSEKFTVSPTPQGLAPRPGMVVSIDPDGSGRLQIAQSARDTKVAGIISGANGIAPGMVMGQVATIADGDLPVAIAGRVYCLCDAGANGAIGVGDLLTTSDTPGHAMKVSDPIRAQGAMIGKAMTPLKGGKGYVLVLVNLF